MTPEGKVKKKVTDLLKKLGIYYFCPVASVYGRAGAFDVVCCVCGFFVGIECKSDASKKPTELQIQNAAKTTAAGGVALLIHSGNIPVLEYTLLRIIQDERKERTSVSSVWPSICG